jgi:DnaJ-domain-containing protein 1
MGIIERLGNVIKSYLNDQDGPVLGKRASSQSYGRDPDLEAAFEELNDYLGQGKEKSSGGFTGQDGTAEAGGGEKDFSGRNRKAEGRTGTGAAVPESLKKDFAELGLPPGASGEECKAAYKRLLKIHHPDRHSGHPGNLKKATEKSARINTAYDRIERWRRNGTAE